MNKFKCECCGAPLKLSLYKRDEWICEYCGTHYKQEHEELPPIRIETFQNPIKTFKVKSLMSDELVKNLGEEKATEMIVHRMAVNMLDELIPYIRTEIEYDPISREHIVTGMIRFVDDSYKF